MMLFAFVITSCLASAPHPCVEHLIAMQPRAECAQQMRALGKALRQEQTAPGWRIVASECRRGA
jgi:hypothetical protein